MNVDVDVKKRTNVPRWLAYGTPVFTIIAALVVSSFALLALEVNPLSAYYQLLIRPLTDTGMIGEILARTVPLALAGLAVYIPLKANLWNIGAEGQIQVGAIVGTFLALTLSGPIYVILPVTLIGATIAGFVWGGIPGYLRAKFGTNEIIVTLMMTFIGLQLTEYMIQGPLQAPDETFPVSGALPDSALVPTLIGNVHAGIIVTLVAVVFIYLLVSKTKYGYELELIGSNPSAATQGGISRFWIYFSVLAIGGALAGIAGQIEVAAQHGRLRSGFSPDYGFTAIPIALLGRNGAFRVLLAALFFGLLFVGGSRVQVIYDVPVALVDIIEALIILFLITASFFVQYQVDVRINGRSVSDDILRYTPEVR